MMLRTLAVLVTASVITLHTSVSAQVTHDRSIGMSASIQGPTIDLLLPIWLSNSIVLAPAVGVMWTEDVGSELRIGLVPRFFLSTTQRLMPYIGARVGAILSSPEVGSSTTDLLVGGAFGGEYFLADQFSIGLESQLNVALSDEKSTRFGSPGKINVNTGAAAMVTIYF